MQCRNICQARPPVSTTGLSQEWSWKNGSNRVSEKFLQSHFWVFRKGHFIAKTAKKYSDAKIAKQTLRPLRSLVSFVFKNFVCGAELWPGWQSA